MIIFKGTHNKSLMTEVVGTVGAVVCVDVDPELVAMLCDL